MLVISITEKVRIRHQMESYTMALMKYKVDRFKKYGNSCSYRVLLSWRLGPDWLFCCLTHIDDRAVQALVREPE